MTVRDVHHHRGGLGHHGAVRQGEDRHLRAGIEGEKLLGVVRAPVEIDFHQAVVGARLFERGMGSEGPGLG